LFNNFLEKYDMKDTDDLHVASWQIFFISTKKNKDRLSTTSTCLYLPKGKITK